jgi:hypothetical protein
MRSASPLARPAPALLAACVLLFCPVPVVSDWLIVTEWTLPGCNTGKWMKKTVGGVTRCTAFTSTSIRVSCADAMVYEYASLDCTGNVTDATPISGGACEPSSAVFLSVECGVGDVYELGEEDYGVIKVVYPGNATCEDRGHPASYEINRPDCLRQGNLQISKNAVCGATSTTVNTYTNTG